MAAVVDARGADALSARSLARGRRRDRATSPTRAHRRALVEVAGDRIDLLVNNASLLDRARSRRSAYPPQSSRASTLAGSRRWRSCRRPAATGGGCGDRIHRTRPSSLLAGRLWLEGAALDQPAILAAEHPELRVYAADPGDMRTQMHQDAFPMKTLDRPLPESSLRRACWR
jgi:hypothetical protein